MYTQSHATSQSLRACSKCTTLPCSEPCHLTVSSSLFGWCATLPCSEPCHLTVSSSLFEVYDSAVFRTMPPHSLLRACSAGVRLCRVQSHATSQSLRACSAGVRLCRVQSHATSQSLRACSKCTTLLCSEPCHLTVSYEPVRLVYDSAVFRTMPPHSLLRACSVRRIRRIAQYKKCLVHASMTSHFLYCAAWL